MTLGRRLRLRHTLTLLLAIAATITAGACGDRDRASSPPLDRGSQGVRVHPLGSGSLIAFSRLSGGTGEIYVVDSGGRHLRGVTRGPNQLSARGDVSPAWSPDGTQIAFVRSRDSGRNEHVEVLTLIRLDGSKSRALTKPMRSELGRPTWSPDGTKVVFDETAPGGDSTLNVIDVTTGRHLSLDAGSRRDHDPAWSSDGRKLAFARGDGIGSSVWVANADATSAKKVAENGTQPAWSPNDARLAFVSGRDRSGETCFDDGCDPNGEIYTMKPDGSDSKRLTIDKAPEAQPSWSPNSAQIVFSSVGGRGAARDSALYTMNSDGTCRTLLLRDAAEAAQPAWQPGREGRPTATPC